MRVLLVNANQLKSPQPVMPLGLCSVAAATEQAGHQVSVLDLCFSHQAARDLKVNLSRFRPDLVGVSVRNLDNSAGYRTDFLLATTRRKVLEPLRAQFSGPIVVGGPPVGINGPEVLDYLGVELGIRGDGEHAFVELLRRMQHGASLLDAGGLVWRRGSRLLANNPPDPVEDLDALPPIPLARYLDLHAYSKYGSPLQVQTKRGCPLSCSYCTYRLIEGGLWRLREPDRVVAEIERLLAATGIRQIEFTDSVFNMPIEHTKAVLRALIRRGLDLNLHAMGLNPAALDEALVDLMVLAGFRSVDVGAESLSNVTLAGLGKSYSKEAVRRAADLLHARGLAVHWFLLVGGPGETPQTLRETLDAIEEIAGTWDLVDIGIGVRVYNGSTIARQMQRDEGAPINDCFFRPVVYRPAGASVETLKRLTTEWALQQTNCFMYDEERVPLHAIRFASTVLGWFAPGQPVWRTFIAHRKLQRLFGLLALRRWWLRHGAGSPPPSRAP